jgi:regulation of enolase protein 1 (concanavalin A-like superfamily)
VLFASLELIRSILGAMRAICCIVLGALASAISSAEIEVIDNFRSPKLRWSHPSVNSSISSDGKKLEIAADGGRDYWARTFYQPLLIKHNASALLADVAAEAEATLELSYTVHPVEQYDQAGILILVDPDTWVKAGIEYVDGKARLSCVVTNNGFSDWSTQIMNSTSLRLRVHKLLPGADQGPAMLMEAAETGDVWTQVRIASLRSGNKPWRMGPFAACPTKQNGGWAEFHDIHLGPKVSTAVTVLV